MLGSRVFVIMRLKLVGIASRTTFRLRDIAYSLQYYVSKYCLAITRLPFLHDEPDRHGILVSFSGKAYPLLNPNALHKYC